MWFSDWASMSHSLLQKVSLTTFETNPHLSAPSANSVHVATLVTLTSYNILWLYLQMVWKFSHSSVKSSCFCCVLPACMHAWSFLLNTLFNWIVIDQSHWWYLEMTPIFVKLRVCIIGLQEVYVDTCTYNYQYYCLCGVMGKYWYC